jgi:hypothetical protein
MVGVQYRNFGPNRINDFRRIHDGTQWRTTYDLMPVAFLTAYIPGPYYDVCFGATVCLHTSANRPVASREHGLMTEWAVIEWVVNMINLVLLSAVPGAGGFLGVPLP